MLRDSSSMELKTVTVKQLDKLLPYSSGYSMIIGVQQLEMLGEIKWEIVSLLPLGNYDMVLGVQWLEMLGEIKWDFKQPRMEFKANRKTC